MRHGGRWCEVKVRRKVHADGPCGGEGWTRVGLDRGTRRDRAESCAVHMVHGRARVHGDEDGVGRVKEDDDGKGRVGLPLRRRRERT